MYLSPEKTCESFFLIIILICTLHRCQAPRGDAADRVPSWFFFFYRLTVYKFQVQAHLYHKVSLAELNIYHK